MDPVFLYVNASHHVLALEEAKEKLSESPTTNAGRDLMQAECAKLARTLPYLRRAIACYLCGRVLHKPVLVLECFHWSCSQCLESGSSSCTVTSPLPSSASSAPTTPTASTSASSTATDAASVVGGGGGGRRRSVRGGDLNTYLRRCRWCEQKLTKIVVDMVRLVCEAYHCLCQILLEHRQLLDSKDKTTSFGNTRTRGSDSRGSIPFLWRLVEESTGTGSAVVLEDEDLPGGVPADDMFTGEYLRIKAQAKGADDRLLRDATSTLSMFRYGHNISADTAHQPQGTLQQQASLRQLDRSGEKGEKTLASLVSEHTLVATSSPQLTTLGTEDNDMNAADFDIKLLPVSSDEDEPEARQCSSNSASQQTERQSRSDSGTMTQSATGPLRLRPRRHNAVGAPYQIVNMSRRPTNTGTCTSSNQDRTSPVLGSEKPTSQQLSGEVESGEGCGIAANTTDSASASIAKRRSTRGRSLGAS